MGSEDTKRGSRWVMGIQRAKITMSKGSNKAGWVGSRRNDKESPGKQR